MQENIQKIITVLNDFTLIDEVLIKTFTFAQKYNARVEILYIHETPLFAIPDFFNSDIENNTIDKEKIKQAIEEKVQSFNPKKEVVIFVKIDDTEDRVWALAREDKETLIITAYHENITQRLIDKVTQPVLVLKTNTETYQKIALVIDTINYATSCIGIVKKHFDQSEIELIYDYHYIVDLGMEIDIYNVQIIEETQREAFEALKKKSGLEGEFFIDGYFLDTQMSDYLHNKNFDILYICSPGDDFFVSDNLAIKLLDDVSCDMLVSSR